ncbi:hypothetical protein ABIF43_006464 [Bradyrhizobium japonicum]
MALEQAGAEGLEFAAGDFLVGRFEQRAQRDEPADILTHAVLHDDRFGFGRVLELDPGDAVFPPRDGGRAHDREQQADGNRDQRRAIQSEQRRGTPPSGHPFPILIVLIATAHLDPQVPIGAARSNLWLSRRNHYRTGIGVKNCEISEPGRPALRGLVNDCPSELRQSGSKLPVLPGVLRIVVAARVSDLFSPQNYRFPNASSIRQAST